MGYTADTHLGEIKDAVKHGNRIALEELAMRIYADHRISIEGESIPWANLGTEDRARFRSKASAMLRERTTTW
jgi:hypothetical protein